MTSNNNQQPSVKGGLDGAAPFRVLPKYSDEEEAFWKGGEHGKLLIQYCEACQRWNHPAGPLCPVCHSREVSTKAVSGRGTVYTYTINVQAWNPTFEHPYVIAVIELEEQADLRLVSNVYGCEADAVYIGMPVEVFFEPWEEIWLPLFRAVGSSGNE